MAKASPPAPASGGSHVFGTAGALALVLCAVIAAYLPSLSGVFIWNDSDYVTAPALRSLRGLALIWTQPGATQQYYPLLHSAFWLEHRLFGDHPLGYHIVTVLLHAAAAVMFGLVLRRLLANAGAAWLAALLFALHPVHVESVAWITEQKNTLSLVLYLASAMAYLRFDRTRRPLLYAGALALFVLSMWCKTVTATLPAALLVVFWWKRGTLSWRRDILPLLPWLAVGAAMGIFSSWVERAYVGAEGEEFTVSFVARCLVAARAVWFYAGKVAWPFGLNFIYPRWTIDPSAAWQWVFPLGLLAVAAALWAVRGCSRAPLAAFLFFVGSLFPVLGFVNLYGARYSWVWDHWQYLPDLGPIALGAAAVSILWNRASPDLRTVGTGLVASLAVLLGALTWSHCGMFHDDVTLFRMTVERNPDSWMAHDDLGCALVAIPGRRNDAIAQFEEVLRLKPDYARAHYNLGCALMEVPGRMGDAIAQFEEALRLKPGQPEVHYNLGCAFAATPGRLDDAITQFRETLRITPNDPKAHNNLGYALERKPGGLDESIAEYELTVRLRPDYAEAHNNLGNAFLKKPGRMNEAVAQFKEALRLVPDYAKAHNNLGAALERTPGRLDDALAEYREALRLAPGEATYHLNVAIALLKGSGHADEAVAQLREALRLQPDNDLARRVLAHVGGLRQ